jgi:nicotinamide-nucleotide amidase
MSSMGSPDQITDEAYELAEQIAGLAKSRGLKVAAAESLTGGKITSHLAAAPNSSEWFRGGVVAYASEVKFDVLGVPVGPVVCEECAQAMATGVGKLLGADAAVAVTGVGGPGEEEDKPPGTVWFGVTVNGETHTELREYDGDPEQILDATTKYGLYLLLQRMRTVQAG